MFAEVFAYLTLAAVFLVGLLEMRLATFLIVLIVVDSFLPSRIIFTFLPVGNEDFSYLPFCFAIGAFIAIHKERITIDASLPLGFAMLAYFFRGNPAGYQLFYLTVFASVLYLATREWVLQKCRLPFDVSYGTYLWGFPIQQMLSKYLPNLIGIGHVVTAMLLALMAGTVSWLLVETKSIEVGKRLTKKFIYFEFRQNH